MNAEQSSALDGAKREPTQYAIRQCAGWLAWCKGIGWRESDMDALEHMWWEYHDDYGNLICTQP